MNAYAALRAIRKTLEGHEAGPGLKRSQREARAALARAEALIARLREMVEDVDTVADSEDADPAASARARAAAVVARVKLAAALARRP